MTGEQKAMCLLMIVGAVIIYSMGYWMGDRANDPTPTVSVCILPLPERQLNGIDT